MTATVTDADGHDQHGQRLRRRRRLGRADRRHGRSSSATTCSAAPGLPLALILGGHRPRRPRSGPRSPASTPASGSPTSWAATRRCPGILGLLHGKYATPHYGVIVLAGVSARHRRLRRALSADNLLQIILASNIGTFLVYGMTNADRRRRLLAPGRAQRREAHLRPDPGAVRQHRDAGRDRRACQHRLGRQHADGHADRARRSTPSGSSSAPSGSPPTRAPRKPRASSSGASAASRPTGRCRRRGGTPPRRPVDPTPGAPRSASAARRAAPERAGRRQRRGPARWLGPRRVRGAVRLRPGPRAERGPRWAGPSSAIACHGRGRPAARRPARPGASSSGPGSRVVVADGLGGHSHGELASRTAVGCVLRRLAAPGRAGEGRRSSCGRLRGRRTRRA